MSERQTEMMLWVPTEMTMNRRMGYILFNSSVRHHRERQVCVNDRQAEFGAEVSVNNYFSVVQPLLPTK